MIQPWIHGGDLVVGQIRELGVDHLFTLTGGHISPIYDAARFSKVKLVDFRHEQAAVHAADAYARVRRDAAVAVVTAGPGVTGAITAVANAFYAESPVVVLGGRNPFPTDGAGNLQDAPHLDLMRPVTRSCAAIYDVWRSTEIVHQAFSAALGPRMGPVYLDLPFDVQMTRISGGAPAIRPRLPRTAMHPDPDAVRAVATRLAAAQQPVVLAGTGAYWTHADDALRALGDVADAPMFLNGMARGILARGHPFHVAGGRRQAMRGADFVLLLGAEFDFRLGFGQPGVFHPEAFVVQVGPDATRLGANRHVDLAIAADVGAFVAALVNEAGSFARTSPRRWTANLLERDRATRSSLDRADSSPVHPLHFVREVIEFLDPDATVIGDGGDIVSAFARWFQPGGPGRWLDPGPFGCLGVGAPFAIGARLHRPSAQIAVIFGDGAFGFNAFEYDSAVRQKLPFVGIMGNDGAWGEMRTFHADVFGESDRSAQYLSQDTAYHGIVAAMGGYGERVERASEIQPALRRAFDAGVPALVNVVLDPQYRHRNEAVSGRNVALAYGQGDADAFKRS